MYTLEVLFDDRYRSKEEWEERGMALSVAADYAIAADVVRVVVREPRGEVILIYQTEEQEEAWLFELKPLEA